MLPPTNPITSLKFFKPNPIHLFHTTKKQTLNINSSTLLTSHLSPLQKNSQTKNVMTFKVKQPQPK